MKTQTVLSGDNQGIPALGLAFDSPAIGKTTATEYFLNQLSLQNHTRLLAVIRFQIESRTVIEALVPDIIEACGD